MHNNVIWGLHVYVWDYFFRSFLYVHYFTKIQTVALFCFLFFPQNHEKNDCPDYPVPCLQKCSQIILKKEVLLFFSYTVIQQVTDVCEN